MDHSQSSDENQTHQSTPLRRSTLTDKVKRHAAIVINPLVRILARTGIHPNVLSVVGFAMALAAGLTVAAGNHFIGGWLFLISGPFDALDGALARTSGLETRFGAFLDSCLDRYSEAAVLCGVLYWSVYQNHPLQVLLCFLTMFGSIMVSYSRARAEGLNLSCKVGIFTRMERFAIIVVMLFTKQLTAGLAILAILTNYTALQRILHVYKQAKHQ